VLHTEFKPLREEREKREKREKERKKTPLLLFFFERIRYSKGEAATYLNILNIE